MKRLCSWILALALLSATITGCQTAQNASGDTGETASSESAAGAQENAVVSGVEAEESGTAPAPEEEPPDNNWELDTPENHGVDSALLADLHTAAADSELNAVVTVKDGVLIDEYYREGYDKDSVFRLASCSKSFTGALIGIAIDQGLIGGVEVAIADYFPQLEQAEDERKGAITIRHLLTHSSGLEWYEWSNGTTFRDFVQSENWVDFVLGRDMAADPGTQFDYTTGGSHLLAAILQEAAGETEYDYAKENLFEPMGMDSAEWRADPQGVTDGGNGISMTARDAAKFGQLYLDGGQWKGQQILPQSWVEDSISVQYERDGNSGSYGYQWWLRPFGEEGYETYYAMGHGGQYIYVVPELALICVMTSSYGNDTYAPWPYFEDYVLAACAASQESAE